MTISPVLTTKTPSLNTWIDASWEEFIAIADASSSNKLKSYYNNRKMRFELMATGSDHSKDHITIVMAVGLFASLRGIPINGHDACSYRKRDSNEFQPDASYYIGETADAIPWGTRVIDLDEYPLPSLVIEISDTSLSDDLGIKRLQYEELEIPEYWIINVQAMEIVAFSIAPDKSTRRIRESQVLPGLNLSILEEALRRSREENQSATTAWLMQQFQQHS